VFRSQPDGDDFPEVVPYPTCVAESAHGNLTILYAGYLDQGNLALYRCLALEELGPRVIRLPYEPYIWADRASLPVRAVRKAAPRLFLGAINRALITAARESRPDVVWIDKGVYFTMATLRRVLEVRTRGGGRPLLFHFHPDDAFHRTIYSALYKDTLRLYDCHFIPHRWVLEDHVRRGAKRVEYWPYGYYPQVHAPVSRLESPGPEFEPDVSFAGRWEKGRAEWLERLAASGMDIGVWGSIWQKLDGRSPLRPHVHFRLAIGSELAAIASLSKISLGFLSETNYDGHTSRTFEIPGCNGFMLAQRSSGQLEFFEEGREMECFDSYEEMHDKILFYLAHESAREKIRAAGRERCIRSGYSYQDRFRFVLDVVRQCRDQADQGGSLAAL